MMLCLLSMVKEKDSIDYRRDKSAVDDRGSCSVKKESCWNTKPESSDICLAMATLNSDMFEIGLVAVEKDRNLRLRGVFFTLTD